MLTPDTVCWSVALPVPPVNASSTDGGSVTLVDNSTLLAVQRHRDGPGGDGDPDLVAAGAQRGHIRRGGQVSKVPPGRAAGDADEVARRVAGAPLGVQADRDPGQPAEAEVGPGAAERVRPFRGRVRAG